MLRQLSKLVSSKYENILDDANSVGEIFGLDIIDLCLQFRSCLVAFWLRNRGDPYSNGMRCGVPGCWLRKVSLPHDARRVGRVRARAMFRF